MKTKREGNKLIVAIEGQLGESSPFFSFPLKDVKEVVIDMKDMTFMNSIGVKQWILWTVKIPKDCHVTLSNCPLMIITQASQVLGFTTPAIVIESIRMPYVCNACGAEEVRLIKRGVEYDYRSPLGPAKVSLDNNPICSKCGKPDLEADLIVEKSFKFLSL